jgi:hypothetical protein
MFLEKKVGRSILEKKKEKSWAGLFIGREKFCLLF